MKKLNLDAVTKIQYPTQDTWGKFYQDWNKSLVEGLGNQHDLMDRQDAVSDAFVKLMMRKDKGEYVHVPETEREWYGCIKWQAKACLSHAYGSRTTREKHHKAAMVEWIANTPVACSCNIDSEVRAAALYRTLREVCREAGMKKVNVEAYIRWYLNGENSADVALELGTTVQNLHVIRFRVEKLLREKGWGKFVAVRAQMFLEAA